MSRCIIITIIIALNAAPRVVAADGQPRTSIAPLPAALKEKISKTPILVIVQEGDSPEYFKPNLDNIPFCSIYDATGKEIKKTDGSYAIWENDGIDYSLMALTKDGDILWKGTITTQQNGAVEASVTPGEMQDRVKVLGSRAIEELFWRRLSSFIFTWRHVVNEDGKPIRKKKVN